MSQAFISPTKPLGGKAYGSIGHLPNSRLGPGDWSVHEGQFHILTEKPRKGDRIIVSEKLDGACMAVANIDGEIVPLTRAGYRARHGRYEHLQLFEVYVMQRYAQFAALLVPGERVAGEWLALAHGTTYDKAHADFVPFVPFDIFRGKDRVLSDEFRGRCERVDLRFAAYVADGPSPVPVEVALKRLGVNGQHGSTEPVEGVVYRCEREGRVDFPRSQPRMKAFRTSRSEARRFLSHSRLSAFTRSCSARIEASSLSSASLAAISLVASSNRLGRPVSG